MYTFSSYFLLLISVTIKWKICLVLELNLIPSYDSLRTYTSNYRVTSPRQRYISYCMRYKFVLIWNLTSIAYLPLYSYASKYQSPCNRIAVFQFLMRPPNDANHRSTTVTGWLLTLTQSSIIGNWSLFTVNCPANSSYLSRYLSVIQLVCFPALWKSPAKGKWSDASPYCRTCVARTGNGREKRELMERSNRKPRRGTRACVCQHTQGADPQHPRQVLCVAAPS